MDLILHQVVQLEHLRDPNRYMRIIRFARLAVEELLFARRRQRPANLARVRLCRRFKPFEQIVLQPFTCLQVQQDGIVVGLRQDSIVLLEAVIEHPLPQRNIAGILVRSIRTGFRDDKLRFIPPVLQPLGQGGAARVLVVEKQRFRVVAARLQPFQQIQPAGIVVVHQRIAVHLLLPEQMPTPAG